MVSTRSTKRRSRSPVAKAAEGRPAKIARKRKQAVKKPVKSFKGVEAVLLDIGRQILEHGTIAVRHGTLANSKPRSEGTICPITFVKDTLFPYALKALPDVLASKWDDPEFVPYREAFPESATSSPEAFEAHVKDLTERDVKIACLKNLQGYLWENGYKTHVYSTPVYPDVLSSLETWSSSTTSGDSNVTSKEISIYSSGSIFAQKLLFQHIKDPSSPEDPRAVLDKRDVIKAWFDTTNAGLKQEARSYVKIAAELGRGPGEILFLSDNVNEVRAAIQAGMKAAVVDRPGNAPLSDTERDEFEVVESFEQIEL
ncbi:2,3-diketo-5-methylthio-1-phosphopentane phosphatase [Fonsecaea pedrosoi CBS 271.37]|uniref:Unplaced genomic scaffold supercont1.2, whole genome shotgun sequence n=1 Tax=Fonsecaea pedrosoi CBS 271.37 TaxID=1442368 RepID=A0A0D2GWC1_9EURO|nr:2,3-diketo-5-methylthio-1-phosphopentane phosphatase [Fonsecaea pedrosoi CBS 271.37]KIW82920.1 2,3-diketo-5-methylthio-1-phosphopentane phosphatase [Fonsecaea pedrosoi CBS 271.37]